ncbi:tetratricopeptide repeat protein [Candidatus Curtissbacteria bacterium]|nr:tetratricopeptide repeat protein [Candidatus Curtissbacteria bacterium]
MTNEDKTLEGQAVSAALDYNWELAIEINKKILKNNPNHIETLNRLARAYFETGNITKSRQTYKSVTDLDGFNVIAKKNLTRLNRLSSDQKTPTLEGDKQNFRELFQKLASEPGKTKVVTLVKIGDQNLLSKLASGDKLKISPKKHSIELCTYDNKHVGNLPDDLSFKLLKLITAGNTFECCIKSVTQKEVQVILFEITRAKALANLPSFTT